jgi:hypothetical protein
MEGGNHAAGALNALLVDAYLHVWSASLDPSRLRSSAHHGSIRSAGRLRFASVVSSTCRGLWRVGVHVHRACRVLDVHPMVEPRAQRRLQLGAEAPERGERIEVAHDEGGAQRGVDEDGGADRQLQEREDALLAEGQGGPQRAGPERVGARYASRALASVRAKRASPSPPSLALALDEQRESRGAVGARLLRGKATAPRSWYAACSRACSRERACAQPRMADPGSVSDDLARAGCGSGQAWLLRPLGSRAPDTGPIATPLARSAVRSPHLSPIVMSGSGRLRGFCDKETWIDRGTRHLRRCGRPRHHVIYGGAARRSYGPWPLGLRLGLCALPWRVAARFVAQAVRKKYPICRYSLGWRDPDSNRGHHDFQQLLAPDDRAGPRPS